MIERLVQDLRYAARTFRRAPGFLLLTVLTIARRRRRQRRDLQHRQRRAAASAAVRDARATWCWSPTPTGGRGRATATRRRRTFSTGERGSTASRRWRRFGRRAFALSGGDRPESVAGAIVNANFFDVLDVKPALGRTFAADRRRAGRAASRGPERRALAATVRRASGRDRPDAPHQRRAAHDHRGDAGGHRLPRQGPSAGSHRIGECRTTRWRPPPIPRRSATTDISRWWRG